MRMWMVNPKVMCRQHLLGEHVECHMFVGALKRKVQMKGYIDNNLMQPGSLQERHDQLAAEMENRGMNHKSPLKEYDISHLPEKHQKHILNVECALTELTRRCERCRGS